MAAWIWEIIRVRNYGRSNSPCTWVRLDGARIRADSDLIYPGLGFKLAVAVRRLVLSGYTDEFSEKIGKLCCECRIF